MKFFDRPLVIPSILLGVSLIIGLAIVGTGIGARGQSDTITVTGSSSQNVKADEATWAVDVRRTAYADAVPAASTQVSRDGKAVLNYFSQQKFASSTVIASVVSSNQNYSNNGEPTSYTVDQTITVTTSDVDAIDTLSHDISGINAVVSSGTLVSPQPPQYYVSSLPALRVSLLGAAIKDAKARAVQIAESGGSTVGALASASSGVVQVLAPNSTNVEDYGEYDTSTVQKEVMVTAHATFYVR
jgi:hypothetical protein